MSKKDEKVTKEKKADMESKGIPVEVTVGDLTGQELSEKIKAYLRENAYKK